ncbi:hypothetical protein B0H21DRAFT_415346 [Amylocystis lapponica]|nr:hypothetical protein B0H21DRAFT_415346 [Amylocystis lapponica]
MNLTESGATIADHMSPDRVLLEDHLLDSSRLDYSNDTFHRKIHDLVKQIADTAPKTQCPPLRALAYAIRNILLPTFLVDQTLDILILLTHVNLIYQNAVSKCHMIIYWDEQFRSRPEPNVLTLADEDSDLLKSFTKEDNEFQADFRHLINECYRLDIYHTYLSPNSAETILRLILYFPTQFAELGELDTRDSPKECMAQRLLHSQPLSDEERDISSLMGLQCAKFVRDASEYERDPNGYCHKHGLPNGSFSKLFPSPDTKVIVTLINAYLQKVEGLVWTLHRLFGSEF